MNPDESLERDERAIPGTSGASAAGPSRRAVLQLLATAGVGTAVFRRALADEASKSGAITAEQIATAEWISGFTLSDEDRRRLAASLPELHEDLRKIRSISVNFDELSCLRFDPEVAAPFIREQSSRARPWLSSKAQSQPDEPVRRPEELAWLPIRTLARLLRQRQISSEELTQSCLQRLRRMDPMLNCVVTLTEDLALQQARVADQELAAGKDRGLLHGIPWGAKDLIAVSGYATTWGIPQFKDRNLPQKAAIASKLEAAGAVLVAKLSTGALAMGDQWHKGKTRNPWNTEQGSSGSSAGSASAVAAGLVPFAIGTETLGSIVSPARRCGVAGLRPSFGRISRAGCMALSWTMDKPGPLARTVDDCGLVFQAVHGADTEDPSSVDRWFQWPMHVDLSALRIGKVTDSAIQAADQAALDHLQSLGAKIIDITLPRDLHEYALTTMLEVEAACIFQKFTNEGVTEGLNVWPGIFQKARFVSAVDYLQASRIRLQLMQKMAEVFQKVDLYVGGDDLGIANLTGHPTIVVPSIMQDKQPQRRPECATLTAGLYDEATLLAVARLIEQKADVIQYHPTLAPETQPKP